MDDHLIQRSNEAIQDDSVCMPQSPVRFVPTYVPRRVSDEQSRQAIREAIVAAPRDVSDRALRPAI